jgi:hypothetical protein
MLRIDHNNCAALVTEHQVSWQHCDSSVYAKKAETAPMFSLYVMLNILKQNLITDSYVDYFTVPRANTY